MTSVMCVYVTGSTYSPICNPAHFEAGQPVSKHEGRPDSQQELTSGLLQSRLSDRLQSRLAHFKTGIKASLIHER